MGTAGEPSISELHAYKVYHHAEYMKETARSAGGTNILLHKKKCRQKELIRL